MRFRHPDAYGKRCGPTFYSLRDEAEVTGEVGDGGVQHLHLLLRPLAAHSAGAALGRQLLRELAERVEGLAGGRENLPDLGRVGAHI